MFIKKTKLLQSLCFIDSTLYLVALPESLSEKTSDSVSEQPSLQLSLFLPEEESPSIVGRLLILDIEDDSDSVADDEKSLLSK